MKPAEETKSQRKLLLQPMLKHVFTHHITKKILVSETSKRYEGLAAKWLGAKPMDL